MATATDSLKGLLSQRFPDLEVTQIQTTVQITAPDQHTNALIKASPQIAKVIGGNWDIIEINGHKLTKDHVSSFSALETFSGSP